VLATGRILSNAAGDDDDDAGGWSGDFVTVYNCVVQYTRLLHTRDVMIYTFL